MTIELVAFKSEYAELFHRWRVQKSFVLHNPLLPLDLDGCRKRLAAESGQINDIWTASTLRWFIRSENRIVGNVSLNSINKMMMTAEIGYGIDEAYQGKRFGTQAISLLLKMVFEKTELRKIFAHVHEENAASCKLLAKLGFKREGLLREHYLVNGKPANEFFYGLLRREFTPIESSTSPRNSA